MSLMRFFMTVLISGSSSAWAASSRRFRAVGSVLGPKILANLLLRLSSMRKYLGRTQTKFRG